MRKSIKSLFNSFIPAVFLTILFVIAITVAYSAFELSTANQLH